MFKQFVQWFEVRAADPRTGHAHTIELATAALLCEIIRADQNTSDDEQRVYRDVLTQHFSLQDNELEELMKLGSEHVEEASDLVQFTRVINAECDAKQKGKILDDLWRIAFADGVLDAHEEHLIRRIADLLHLPHSQYIQSKLKAAERS
ncbi:TerB family tellurite resistance protein [Aestuariibacter salexigens]|uniref:tellurite resistance TerB family protein n=1 Tax=Aestuariibacter salexigens TaxID=226010 RepID=UPI00040C2A08|nr:TerB family tellurite resistance protein [Aestuariibacter salexigens]